MGRYALASALSEAQNIIKDYSGMDTSMKAMLHNQFLWNTALRLKYPTSNTSSAAETDKPQPKARVTVK